MRLLFVALLFSCILLVGCASSGKGNTYSSWGAFGNSNAQIFNKTWGLKF